MFVISGTLNAGPLIKEIKFMGKSKKICRADITVEEGGKGEKIKVNVVAYDENAVELKDYRADDAIQFIGMPVDMEDHSHSVLGFEIVRIDRENVLADVQEQFFSRYLEEGKIV